MCAELRIRSLRCIALTTLALAAGCTTAAQRQARQSATEIRTASLANNACIKAVVDKPEYASLLPHTPMLDGSQPTMAQLTDETIPSVEDAKLFAARFDEMAPCRGRYLAAVSRIRPDLAPIMTEAVSDRAATVALVVERKITWAEYTRRLQAASRDFQQKISAANQQWIGERAAEAAQQQQINMMLIQTGIQMMQRPIPVPSGPTSVCHAIPDFGAGTGEQMICN
jgi:hypothetical protein